MFCKIVKTLQKNFISITQNDQSIISSDKIRLFLYIKRLCIESLNFGKRIVNSKIYLITLNRVY